MKKHKRSNNPVKSLCGRVYFTEADLALVDSPSKVTCLICSKIIGNIRPLGQEARNG